MLDGLQWPKEYLSQHPFALAVREDKAQVDLQQDKWHHIQQQQLEWQQREDDDEDDYYCAKLWLVASSATVIIPKELARKYSLDKPYNILMFALEDGKISIDKWLTNIKYIKLT